MTARQKCRAFFHAAKGGLWKEKFCATLKITWLCGRERCVYNSCGGGHGSDQRRSDASGQLGKLWIPAVGRDEKWADSLESQRYHPDIILTDIKMPVMTGLENGGRAGKSGMDTQVILLTATMKNFNW